jgi:hypothetical protein
MNLHLPAMLRKLPGHHSGSLLVILLVALVVRLAICFFSGLPQITSDSLVYMQMAYDIIDGTPRSFFPNGFPLLIAGVASVWGSNDIVAPLMLINVILSVCVVGLVYGIASPILGHRYALLAAWLTALWPNQLYYVCQVMSEVPAAFFLTAALFFLLRRRPLPGGLLLAIAGMLRVSLVPVAPVVVLAFLADRTRRRDALLLMTVVAGCWAGEYALLSAGVVRASSNVGMNLLIAVSDLRTLALDQALGGFSDDELVHPLSTYLTFAIAHPAEFFLQRLLALYDLWGPWPDQGDVNSPRTLLARLVIGLRFPLLLLALLGLWTRRRDFASWIVASPVLLVTAIHIMFFAGQPRFTLPVEPLAMILAAAGIAELVQRLAGMPDRGQRTSDFG